MTLHDGITDIRSGAFYACHNLVATDFELPKNIVTIGGAAFTECAKFTGTLTIPSTLTTIGYDAFRSCTGLYGELVIPETVKSIGYGAFRFCSGFTGHLTLPSSITKWEGQIFSNCSGLTGLTIPDGVTVLGTQLFTGNTNMTGTLTIPNTVVDIQSAAFAGTGFTGELVIPESVQSIGINAFSGCKKFTGDLTIPASVSSLGIRAFEDCTGFNGTVTILSPITEIPLASFANCKNIRQLILPQTLTTIGGQAFQNCEKLESLTLPESLTVIQDYAFVGNLSISKHLVIPKSVTRVGMSAFSNNRSLPSVVFEAGDTPRDVTFGPTIFSNSPSIRYIDVSSLSINSFANMADPNSLVNRGHTLKYFPAGVSFATPRENVVIGDVCDNFILFENSYLGGSSGVSYGSQGYEYATSIIKNFTATSAVYKGKSLTDDGVYTIYLPYEMTLPTGVEAYTLSSYGGKIAVFTKHTGALKAYTPYLLKLVDETSANVLSNSIMSNVSVATAPDYLTNQNAGTTTDANRGVWKFLGTTSPISSADAEANRLYVLEADNTWRPVKASVSGGYVRSLRAFLQAPEGYSGAPLAFMLDEGDATTGLETIEAEVKKENVDIYTVEGRFVGRNYESLPSGLYIIGGKKVYKF